MLAAVAVRQSSDDPLSGLEVGERPRPEPRPGWAVVEVRAAGAQPPRPLVPARGRPARRPAADDPRLRRAGVDEDGNEVIVHAVIAVAGQAGDETLDPGGTLLSELHDGTLAEQVAVPAPQPGAQAGGVVLRPRLPACRRPG